MTHQFDVVVERDSEGYFKEEWCVRIVENPIRGEPQEHNRFRFWGACAELDGRYLRGCHA